MLVLFCVGECLVLEWLDGVCYVDMYGYYEDYYCDMWFWWDWVIGVFNDNMFFDQFMVE